MANDHKVIIVGGGFGGLRAAQALKGAPVNVTLIDQRNFHLLTVGLGRHLTAAVDWKYFIAGPFLRESGPASTSLTSAAGWPLSSEQPFRRGRRMLAYRLLQVQTQGDN